LVFICRKSFFWHVSILSWFSTTSKIVTKTITKGKCIIKWGGGGEHYDFVIFLKKNFENFHFSNVNLTKFVNFFNIKKLKTKTYSWGG
jgi:hypothetical protein